MTKVNTKFRTMIESVLTTHWKANGFQQRNLVSWSKTSPRCEVTFTFHDEYIERYVREYPASEGWYTDKFLYSKKTLAQLQKGGSF